MKYAISRMLAFYSKHNLHLELWKKKSYVVRSCNDNVAYLLFDMFII